MNDGTQSTPAPGSLDADAAGFAALGQALAQGSAPGSAPASQPQNVNAETGEAAPAFTSEQQGAFAQIDTMRAQLMDPARDKSLDTGRMQKLSELQRFANGVGERPSWLEGGTPDPRLTDQSEHDPLARSLEGALRDAVTDEQASHWRTNMMVRGLAADAATVLSDIARGLGMPQTILRQIGERALLHGTEFGQPPRTADDLFSPLDKATAGEYALEASRLLGGTEKFNALTNEVRGLLQQHGLLSGWDRVGLTKCSLSFDPTLLLALRGWLSTKPH